MNFKELFQAVLTALGLTAKAKANTLTPEEWSAIDTEFKKMHGKALSEALAESKRNEELEAERNAALALINQSAAEGAAQGTLLTSVSRLLEQNAELNQALSTLAQRAAEDRTPATHQRISVYGPGTNATHLFGIEHSMFSLNHRYNRISANPALAQLEALDEEKDGAELRSAVRSYGMSLSKRYAYLKANRMLNADKLMAGTFAPNTDNLKDAGLGEQYVVLRQDALIAHVLKRMTVTSIFPMRSGIQDRELMTNAFFSDISQPWQPGKVFKGGMKLEPEMGYVDDAMAKVFFPQMKELERLYIGYLNTNGSDPIKWSMIEWMIVHIYDTMISEQNHRHIMGCFVKPTADVPGHYLQAGTGIVHTLFRYARENKILPLSHPAYNSYTETTMLDAVKEFCKDFMSVLDVDQQASNYVVYLNDRHRPWYRECIRTKYHLDTDFSGTGGMMSQVPDTDISIQWVPNMDNLKLMFIQLPGNLQLLENLPGEMLAVRMKDEMEAVIMWSVWKEGASASYVGMPHADYAALKENNYALQRIFMNLPSKTLEAGATTADANEGIIFTAGKNTAATALTDIENARQGQVYTLRIEDIANPTSIAKSGKFSKLTAAFTPKKEGDYILLTLNDAGDGFVDLERCVDGVRTINQTLQPNIPGGRK